jgi:hypothetical protein
MGRHFQRAGICSEEECNALMGHCREIEPQIMALPPTSAADFTVKSIIGTRYGGWIEDETLLAEALALTGGRKPL